MVVCGDPLSCYHVPERRDTAEKKEENDGAYPCYSEVCRRMTFSNKVISMETGGHC